MSSNLQPPSVEVIGIHNEPVYWDISALSRIAPEYQVEDLSGMMPGMAGRGVRVAGLFEGISLPELADHVTFYSGDGRYSASLTLEQARDFGILVYERERIPLPSEKGGPFRLVTPGLGDLCANVKNVVRIEVSAGSGPDSRPAIRSC